MMDDYSNAGRIGHTTDPYHKLPPLADGGKAMQTQRDKPDPMRTFPDLSRRVAIAHETASAAQKELDEVRDRLGLRTGPRGDGCVTDHELNGEIDALTRSIESLTDTVRNIRGLAETLNSQL